MLRPCKTYNQHTYFTSPETGSTVMKIKPKLIQSQFTDKDAQQTILAAAGYEILS
jgi:hypothetical protein